MLGLSLWEGRLPGQKTIENEDRAAIVLTGQKVTLARVTVRVCVVAIHPSGTTRRLYKSLTVAENPRTNNCESWPPI